MPLTRLPFSPMMVRANRADIKTQTRRTIRGLHPDCVRAVCENGIDWKFYDQFDRLTQATRCPYGVPGNRLLIIEAFRFEETYDHLPPAQVPLESMVHYDADGPAPEWAGRYRNARFMPKWVSRDTVELMSVRVERLQDISAADAIAEGIYPAATSQTIDCDTSDPRAEYQELWESINGLGSWDVNPLLWVLQYRRI